MGQEQKLLIAEDEPVMRLAIKEALSGLDNYEIIEAGDGVEALRVITDVNPDLIVLDLLMPEMDGIDLLLRLQERGDTRPHGKIVVLSAVVGPHIVEQLQQLGAHRVVSKPFHIDELLKTVEEVCAS